MRSAEMDTKKQFELYLQSMAHLLQIDLQSSSAVASSKGEDREKSTLVTAKENQPAADGKTHHEPMQVDDSTTATSVTCASSTTSKVTYVDVCLDKVSTWKSGAITATLRNLGLDPGKKKTRLDPEKEKTEADLESFLFRPVSFKPEQVNERSTERAAVGKRLNKYDGINPDYLLNPDPAVHQPFRCPVMKKPKLEDNTANNLPSTSNFSGTNNLQSSDWKSHLGSRPVGLFSSVSSVKRPQVSTSVNNSTAGNRISTTIDANPDTNLEESDKSKVFRTAYEQLIIDDKAKGIRRTLGNTNIGPPSRKLASAAGGGSDVGKSGKPEVPENPELAELMAHDQLKVFDPKLVEAVLSEIMEAPRHTNWNDIAGLEGPKAIIKEIIIWPMLRPDIFKGLRASPRGILLFGPPGNGKTMIGRLIATQSSSTFFNISASSLTSKWIGDGEKMVRCLFQVARIKQPSVIFIDEIDSILTQRSDTEHESSRRLKTEFLIQFDGCGTSSEDRVLVIGVTNRPQELDEAARRRLVKRIYIPLPDSDGRKKLLMNLMCDQNSDLSDSDFDQIAEITNGYSGADMQSLCQDASYGPIRDIGDKLENIGADEVRPIRIQDFLQSAKRVKASVAVNDLSVYEDWDSKFGCHIEKD